MSRRPIEAEVKGLQTPRERIWASIRKLGKRFTIADVQDGCNPMVLIGCVDDYMDDLEKAGFIVKVSLGTRPKGRPAHCSTGHEYDLVAAKNQFDAPRLNNGKPVTQGLGVLAMWRAMKVLKDFDHNEIAAAASLGGVVVKHQAAKSYVRALATAGYFQTIKKGTGGIPARYRLIKNTGAHPPAITRRKCVFDRNTGTFAELETAQEVVDGLGE